MSKVYKVIHKKSNVVNDGAPKLPQASLLEYGEIAINYGVSGETLSIKNSADQIVTFPSRDIIDRMVEGKGYLTGYTETDPTVPSWAKAESKPSYTASEVGAMATSERGNYLTTATTIPSIAGLVASVDYDSTGKTIVFYDSSDNVVDSIDATDFIKDGMVDSVAIATPTGGTNSGITCLVVTFNTDAGKEDIEIPLSNIFNPANYYNKTQADQTFLSQSAYTEDEEVVASALNDLNDRIEEINVPSYTSELNNDSGFITSAYTGFSPTGHTHSQYSTTAHTHTAAEVGAMATSERSNYLTTGATLDNVADGTTRKLSDYLPLSGGTVNGNVKISGSTNYLRVNNGGSSKTATLYGDSLALGNIVLMNPNAASVFGANNIVFQQKDGKVALLSDVPTEANIEASGFTKNALTGYTETDPTVPSWAKAANKPSYTAAEVGAMATSERGNYLTTATTIPTEASIEASGFTKNALTGYTETDPTVPSWAKAANKPTYTAAEVGAMATSERSNYSTTAHTHTAAEVGAMATSERSNYLTTATTIPTESTISSSGFTKNGITGINVNGTASTVTNGVADITIPSGLPAVTATDNGKILQVVNGAWALVTPTTVYTGTDVPLSSVGNDGDIYLQTS
jgi:hypothetical protein